MHLTFYEQHVLPHLINWSMRQPTFREYRSRLLQNAEGCVLEIGIGSGPNLPYYGRAVKSWLDLVERWFADITRKRIRRGRFRSLADLIRAIEEYVAHHNGQAEPFHLDRHRGGDPPQGASP